MYVVLFLAINTQYRKIAEGHPYEKGQLVISKLDELRNIDLTIRFMPKLSLWRENTYQKKKKYSDASN